MSICQGWSLYRHERDGLRAITLFCRSWSCPDCFPKRLASVKAMAREGRPTAFLTLTVNPKTAGSSEARARALSDAFKLLVKRIRRNWPQKPLHYMAVFEATKKGEPHLHVLMRAPFVPQKWISDVMRELIDAPIVDIRKVGSARNAARYVAKYVGKGPKPFASLKRYWTSRGYNVEQDRPPTHDGEGFALSPWRVVQEPLFIFAETIEALGFQVLWSRETEFITTSAGAAGFYR